MRSMLVLNEGEVCETCVCVFLLAQVSRLMTINVYLTYVGHNYMVFKNHHPHSHVVSHDRPKAASHPQWLLCPRLSRSARPPYM